MTTYRNGEVPASALVPLDSGTGNHLSTPASRARWYALRAKVRKERNVLLRLNPGYSAYRPLAIQKQYRAEACAAGNCYSAAVPGTSSHGGNWYRSGKWVDAMAFDVDNWNAVPWTYFVRACASVGLSAGLITPEMANGASEWHHIIDLNPYSAIPAFDGSEPFPGQEEPGSEREDNEMILVTAPDTHPALMEVGAWSIVDDGEKLGVASKVASRRVDFATKREFQVARGLSLYAMTPDKVVKLAQEQIDQIVAAAVAGGTEAVENLEFVVKVVNDEA